VAGNNYGHNTHHPTPQEGGHRTPTVNCHYLKKMPAYGKIVRYGAPRSLFRTSPYARAAAHVYNNRKTYARVARKVTRSARAAYAKRSKSRRAAKIRARRHFGEPVGTSNCKQRNVLDDVKNMQARVLYGTRLDQIPLQGPYSHNERVTRSRNIINFRGVKMCIRFSSTNDSRSGGKIGLNLAVVVPKDKCWEDNKQYDDPSHLMNNFFRSNKNNGDRAMDFPGFGTPPVWEMLPTTTHCQPLNTDALAVISHQRRIITTPPGGSNNSSLNPWGTDWFVKKYIKINRQLRFNTNADSGDDDTYSTSPMWLLWWCDDFANTKSSQPNLDIVKGQMDCTAYFRHTDA